MWSQIWQEEQATRVGAWIVAIVDKCNDHDVCYASLLFTALLDAQLLPCDMDGKTLADFGFPRNATAVQDACAQSKARLVSESDWQQALEKVDSVIS